MTVFLCGFLNAFVWIHSIPRQQSSSQQFVPAWIWNVKKMLKRCEEEVEEILSEVGGVPDSLVVYLWYMVHY
jgi:hypothetical protein